MQKMHGLLDVLVLLSETKCGDTSQNTFVGSMITMKINSTIQITKFTPLNHQMIGNDIDNLLSNLGRTPCLLPHACRLFIKRRLPPGITDY